MEMVLQRAQDIRERLELLWCQRVSEVLLYRPHVGRGRAPEDSCSVSSQGDLSAAAVGGAIVTADKPPSLHPPEVMR